MSEPHLDDATWEQLATNELSTEARTKALEHVMVCQRCRTIHRGLRELEAGARDEGLLPARPLPKRRAWIAAAVVAVAAAAALVFWFSREREERVVRGGDGKALVVRASTETIAWDAQGDSYAVEVFADDGTLAWSTQTNASSMPWPKLAAGKYRVRVSATRDGATTATSKLVVVEVAP